MTATALRPSTSPPSRREVPPYSRPRANGTPRRGLLVGTALAAGACFALVSFLSMDSTSDRDVTQFAHATERQCNQGEALACNNLGVLYQQGIGVPSDEGRAARYFERACGGGHGEACSNLGAMYQNGLGVAQDIERARTLYERACEQGSALGCSNLGVLYVHAQGVPENKLEAKRLFRVACDGGSSEGCDNFHALASSIP